MAWIAPKLDWLISDSINFADFNRIENNIRELASYLNSIQYTVPTNPYCLTFDGSDDYVDCGTNINPRNAITLEAFVKPANMVGTKTIVCKYTNPDASLNGLSWILRYSGSSIEFYTNSGTFGALAYTHNKRNEWFHLAASYDGATRRLFIDGVQVANDSYSGVIIDTTAPVTIGQSGFNGGSERWEGSIDEVRIWSIARTEAEIQSNVSKYLRGDETGLIGYWKMNEGFGQPLDSSRNGSSGILVGGTSWSTNTPTMSEQDIVVTRDMTSIDFLSSINRIEQNIETIRTNFLTPPGYLDAGTWTVGKGFDFNDANRLEANIKLLMDYGLLVFKSFRYSGSAICGEQGVIY